MTAGERNDGRAMMLALCVGAVLAVLTSVLLERMAKDDINCVIEDCTPRNVLAFGAPAVVLTVSLLLIRSSVGRLRARFFVLLVLVVTACCYAWPLVAAIAEVPQDAVADELKGVLGVIATALISLLPSVCVVVVMKTTVGRTR
jgi:hypothetical protein